MLDLADGVPDGEGGLFAPCGEGDSFRSSVVGIRSALEVSEAFELAEEVVDRLLAHASPGGKLGGSCPLWPGVEQEVQVGRVQVVESVLVQTGEHPTLHLLPWHTQKGADERRPKRPDPGCLSKAT